MWLFYAEFALAYHAAIGQDGVGIDAGAECSAVYHDGIIDTDHAAELLAYHIIDAYLIGSSRAIYAEYDILAHRIWPEADGSGAAARYIYTQGTRDIATERVRTGSTRYRHIEADMVGAGCSVGVSGIAAGGGSPIAKTPAVHCGGIRICGVELQ